MDRLSQGEQVSAGVGDPAVISAVPALVRVRRARRRRDPRRGFDESLERLGEPEHARHLPPHPRRLRAGPGDPEHGSPTGATSRWSSGAATFLLGVIGTIMTVYVLLDVLTARRKFGLFIAIIAVIGVTVGGYLTMQDEGRQRLRLIRVPSRRDEQPTEERSADRRRLRAGAVRVHVPRLVRRQRAGGRPRAEGARGRRGSSGSTAATRATFAPIDGWSGLGWLDRPGRSRSIVLVARIFAVVTFTRAAVSPPIALSAIVDRDRARGLRDAALRADQPARAARPTARSGLFLGLLASAGIVRRRLPGDAGGADGRRRAAARRRSLRACPARPVRPSR